jgi:hypothetical protein
MPGKHPFRLSESDLTHALFYGTSLCAIGNGSLSDARDQARAMIAAVEPPMLVNLYNDPDGEPYVVGADLRTCYPDDPDGYTAARRALELQGQYWDGGGAAPAIFIARHYPEPDARISDIWSEPWERARALYFGSAPPAAADSAAA